jgi:YVTN family beta-propeller protein
MRGRGWYTWAVALGLGVLLLAGRVPAVTYWHAAGSLPSHKYASSAIAITADGTILLVVNPDSNSLSLVDLAADHAVIELPVGVDPRAVAVDDARGRAYVANQGSDTISIVDLSARSVVETVAVGDRPVGVAVSPDGQLAAVAELGEDRVRLLDGGALHTRAIVPVADRPHGLAFTPDGRQLLISHLLSGQVTLLALRPFALYFPIVSGSTLLSGLGHGMRSRASGEPIVKTIATWPNIAPAPSVTVNGSGTRAYLPQTMANGRGLNTGFDTTVFPKVSVLDLKAGIHLTREHIPLPERDQPVGLPWDAALARGDTELWVVHAGSNDLSVLDISDPSYPRRTAHLTVGDNPRGIVIHPDGHTAYVNNVLAGTVSVIDAEIYTVTEVITSTVLPLPPTLLHGKRLYHSSARPDLALAKWISCNTCHIEGEGDGRTWLLQYTGEVPVGATPIITRNTTSLLGMIETYPLRWSAEWDESADSEFSIRFEQFGQGLIEGQMHPTLGAPNAGRSYNLDCLAAFIDSLAVPARTHTLTPAERRGKAIFESAETDCLRCHPPPLYTDLKQHDVGTADAPGEWFGPAIDTPTLRYLYDSAPYLHDGSAATLHEVLTTANPQDAHGVTSVLAPKEIDDLVAFLRALPYTD